MRTDAKTIAFVSEILNEIFKDNLRLAVTSATEDFGFDFPIKDVLTGEDDAHVEVKTKNCNFDEWDIATTGSCICLGLVPSTGHTIDKFPRYWESKPTQAEISAYKCNEREKGERVRWFCLNAACGSEFSYSREPKWLKMYNDDLSQLVILFSDGLLLFDHQQLLDAVVSYGYLYTYGHEEFADRGKKYWQFKVFLDIDKGTFYPCKVPQEILPKRKNYS